MKPARFDYHAPTTVPEVLEVLSTHGDEAKPLAGGQSLVPMLAMRLARFEHLVDLNGVAGLRGVQRVDGSVAIGATTTQAAVGRDPVVARWAPLLARATPLIGHAQIRNRGTIGGSLAHADPASEYPAVALALDAEVEVAGPHGTRRMPVEDLLVSTWVTALAADEILTAVHVPVAPGRSGCAVEEVARRHGDFALVGAACTVTLDDHERVAGTAVALFGVAPTAVRARPAEAALTGRPLDELDADALREVAASAAADLDPLDDIHALGRYRRRVAAHVVQRALTDALREAADG